MCQDHHRKIVGNRSDAMSGHFGCVNNDECADDRTTLPGSQASSQTPRRHFSLSENILRIIYWQRDSLVDRLRAGITSRRCDIPALNGSPESCQLLGLPRIVKSEQPSVSFRKLIDYLLRFSRKEDLNIIFARCRVVRRTHCRGYRRNARRYKSIERG